MFSGILEFDFGGVHYWLQEIYYIQAPNRIADVYQFVRCTAKNQECLYIQREDQDDDTRGCFRGNKVRQIYHEGWEIYSEPG